MSQSYKTVISYALTGGRDFLIPFEYLARKFIVATLVGPGKRTKLDLNTDYRFSTKKQITTNVTWPAGEYQQIEIRRFTSATDRLVNFNDGSILRATDLNLSQIQSLHVAEEARDLTVDLIGLDSDGNYDVKDHRIVNVADGVGAQDAVTMHQLNVVNGSAGESANRSEAAAIRSESSRDAAKASELVSVPSAATAMSAAQSARTSADAVGKIIEYVDGNWYHPPVAYTAGLVVIDSKFTVALNDRVFFANPEQLPFTTPQIFNRTQWFEFSNISKETLALPSGSSLIGHKGTPDRTVSEQLDILAFGIANITDPTYGADPTGIKDSSAAVLKAIATGKLVVWPEGTFSLNIVVTKKINWQGHGNSATILKAFDPSKPVVQYDFVDENWSYAKMSDMMFKSTGEEYTAVGATGIGFSFGDPAVYTPRIEYVGRVIFNRITIRGFHMGVRKSYGHIGNVFNQCSIQNNHYGLWAMDARTANPASDQMQPDTDVFNGGEMHGNSVAALCYIAKNMAVGQLQLNQTVMQFNPGFGVFLDYENCNGVNAFVTNNVWLEGNGTLATVDIITSKGVETLKPQDVLVRGIWEYAMWGSYGHTGGNGIGTNAPNATLGIWGNQRSALNLISGGYAGASWTRIAFSEQGTEQISGAAIESHKEATGTARDLRFLTDDLKKIPLSLRSSGSVLMGDDAVKFGNPAAGSHLIYGPDVSGGGLLVAIGSKQGYRTNFSVSDADGRNAESSTMAIGRVASTNRSINAGGTVNAFGADYAEYLTKSDTCGLIAKGDIVGLDVNGKITDKWDHSLSFLVKTTNPSYVGGDSWGTLEAIGKEPDYPDVSGMSDVEKSEALESYDHRMFVFRYALEAARQTVDRLSFSGQVPVNVEGAQVGDYIVPVHKGGHIGGIPIKDPSMSQYLLSVGKVIRITDGRPEIIVKPV